MRAPLKRIDHVTCVVRPDTIERWAWFYIDVLGGVLTLRTDDTNPSGDSSMMVWTIDFEEFGVALIAGVDREEVSHVTAFAEKHGDHSFQHVAFQVSNLDAFRERLSSHGVDVLGDTLAREDGAGRVVKQVFGNPFHGDENSSLVGFYEFVERPSGEERDAGAAEPPPITFSTNAGKLLYEQAQSQMLADRRERMTRFSKMPPGWTVPEPRPDLAARDPAAARRRPGRREHDAELLGDIQRWHSYRSANARWPDARDAELAETCRLAAVTPGETIAEIGAGSGALTFRLARAVGSAGRLFTYDVSRDNLASVMLANEDGLPIIPVPQSVAEGAPTFPSEGEFDAVVTLATFHHFDDRSVASGTRGRRAAAAALYRRLKRGGRLILGDVAQGTAPQRYFDAIDDPRYCHPRGHPHDFLTGPELADLLCDVGFTEVVHATRRVDWVFASKAAAIEFLGAMHNAQCPEDEVRAIAERHLRFEESSGRCRLHWELLFVDARKR
jgi:SAM-dependent methyltransferase